MAADDRRDPAPESSAPASAELDEGGRTLLAPWAPGAEGAPDETDETPDVALPEVTPVVVRAGTRQGGVAAAGLDVVAAACLVAALALPWQIGRSGDPVPGLDQWWVVAACACSAVGLVLPWLLPARGRGRTVGVGVVARPALAAPMVAVLAHLVASVLLEPARPLGASTWVGAAVAGAGALLAARPVATASTDLVPDPARAEDVERARGR